MPAAIERKNAVHLVGSIAMDNCEEVFTRISTELGPYLDKIPDGETGERSRWIYFQRAMLMEHPAMEIDPTVPELELHQWDGKLLRSLPLIRFKKDADTTSVRFETGYDKAAAHSYNVFRRMKEKGSIHQDSRFQVCLPTPMASGYMYISPKCREEYHRIYERSLLRALDQILDHIPQDQLAIQFDVCQEVLVFEDYFPQRPEDYRQQVFLGLSTLGDAVPPPVQVGYHLCYGSPYDEHLVMPKDMSVLVEIMNGITTNTKRGVDFLHIPIPKDRMDDAYFQPLSNANIGDRTKLYLGLVHYGDEDGDRERIATARKFVKQFGIATECGWGRSDPKKIPGLLSSHQRAAELL